MNRVVLDESALDKLDGHQSGVEVCDESGRSYGIFISSTERLREIYDWAWAQLPDEELERRRAEPGGRTTAEVLAALKGR